MEERVSYSVLWKTLPNQFESNPQWRSFMGYVSDYATALDDFRTVTKNPRCWKAKIVMATETFTDVPDHTFERESND